MKLKLTILILSNWGGKCVGDLLEIQYKCNSRGKGIVIWLNLSNLVQRKLSVDENDFCLEFERGL